ncbi:unnamed protein product [Victoria cruziana]
MQREEISQGDRSPTPSHHRCKLVRIGHSSRAWPSQPKGGHCPAVGRPGSARPSDNRLFLLLLGQPLLK